MSSDLFYSDGERGELFVEMNVRKYLYISSNSDDPESEDTTYVVAPTEEGREEIQKLIGALQSWLDLTKED